MWKERAPWRYTILSFWSQFFNCVDIYLASVGHVLHPQGLHEYICVFTTMSKLWAEFNLYLMWLNFVHLIGQYAHWIFMRFFEVFNHSLQLQLTRTHTSETVVAKVVLKMNFPSYFLLTLAGIHGGKRTIGYYMNLYLAQFLLFGWGLGLLSRGVMFTRLTWL